MLKKYIYIIIGVVVIFLWGLSLYFISSHYRTTIDNQEVAIDFYQEGVTQILTKINDSTKVWVAKTHDLIHTRDSITKANLALLKAIGVKENKIQSLSSFNAVLDRQYLLKLDSALKDSVEILRGVYEDIYNSLVIDFNPIDSSLQVTFHSEIPIVQSVVKIKYRYLEKKFFISRWWSRLWEKPSLEQILTSPVENIKFLYPQYIQINE